MKENRPTLGKITYEQDEQKSQAAIDRINDTLVEMGIYYLQNRDKFPTKEKTKIE